MIEEGRAGSIGELLAEVRRICRGWASVSDPSEIWFRGQSCREQTLIPALYRPDVLVFHYDETSLFERSRVLAAPHVRRGSVNDWDWYFLARHHGLPSRLLDWSESLLVATYFALTGHMTGRTRLDVDRQLACQRKSPQHDESSPCVWIMDAGTLNKCVCGEDLVFVPGGPRTERYLPDVLFKDPSSENELPVAILPPRTNERIVAQQGMFTLHGHSMTPIDTLASPDRPEPVRLGCISLDRAGVCHMWDELQVLGVGRLGLFPELDSVASHVSWVCQSAT